MRCSSALFAILLLCLASGPALAGPADGIFKGKYTCAQGETGVVLSIVTNARNRVRVIFSFYDLDGNGSVPTGIYDLDGTYKASTRTVTTRDEGRWIAQPSGYVTTGFTARLNSDGSRLAGNLHLSSCSSIVAGRLLPKR